MLEKLNKANDFKVYSVEDEEFKSFGRILSGYDFSEMIHYMEEKTEIPESGNVYVASVEGLEQCDVFDLLSVKMYGGMPIQAGFCNGRNSTFNGFEYHKGSEINVAVTDFCLSLGHSYDIRDNSYDIDEAKVFFVKKGTAIEMFQTTLHLSPLKVNDDGFKGVVILPKGTNTPLSEEERKVRDEGCDPENRLLLQRNKWVIAHPDREPLVKQGACTGVKGVNKELKF